MQGDDTIFILTTEAADQFGITLQKYLTNNSVSVGEAFTRAFEETTPKRTGIFTKAPTRPSVLPAQAVPVAAAAREITCEYCGGVYLSDLLNCPHCGAGRPANTPH